MIKVKQFDHVNLAVQDVERATRFYTEVLGLKLVRRDVDALGRATFVSVKAGPQIVDLMPKDDYEPPENPWAGGWDHLALVVEPCDPRELIAYLRASGVEVYRGPVEVSGAYGMGTAVYFLDPDRHAVELKQYPPGAEELT
jgi:catechol 2,3-dioxygenase-like lactoylglutathione lyase family enzyme